MSPYALLQERVPHDGLYPWRVLVVCALLNRTHRRQVRPMYEALFAAFPSPARLAAAGDELEAMLAPLGLGTRRAALLRRLSADYNAGTAPEQCAGVGQYARDALAIFVRGRSDVRPTDRMLSPYLTWRKRYGSTTEKI